MKKCKACNWWHMDEIARLECERKRILKEAEKAYAALSYAPSRRIPDECERKRILIKEAEKAYAALSYAPSRRIPDECERKRILKKEAEKAYAALSYAPSTAVVSSPGILEEIAPSRRILEEVAPSRPIVEPEPSRRIRIPEEVAPLRLVEPDPVAPLRVWPPWPRRIMDPEPEPVAPSRPIVEPPPPYVPQPSEIVNRQPIPNHFREDLVHMSSVLQWTCVVCMERMDEERVNLTPCFHKVCTWCESQLKDARCPVCRLVISK